MLRTVLLCTLLLVLQGCWLGSEPPQPPRFHAGDCLAAKDEDREPWSPAVDWYVQQVGKQAYLLIRPDDMPRIAKWREKPIIVGFEKSRWRTDERYEKVTCPRKW